MRVLCGLRYGPARIDWLWEPRDVWVGIYWCLRWDMRYADDGLFMDRRVLHVYVCPVPLLPLRLRLPWPERERGGRRGDGKGSRQCR